MDKKLASEIGALIQSFNQSLQEHIPALENEVSQLINAKSTDVKIIEHYLDTLLSLAMTSIGEKLFVQLLDYYKTIDAEAALFYWNKYDREEEDDFFD